MEPARLARARVASPRSLGAPAARRPAREGVMFGASVWGRGKGLVASWRRSLDQVESG